MSRPRLYELLQCIFCRLSHGAHHLLSAASSQRTTSGTCAPLNRLPRLSSGVSTTVCTILGIFSAGTQPRIASVLQWQGNIYLHLQDARQAMYRLVRALDRVMWMLGFLMFLVSSLFDCISKSARRGHIRFGIAGVDMRSGGAHAEPSAVVARHIRLFAP